MVLDREMAELIVHATSGRKDRILKNLKELGFEIEDASEESGLMNLRIRNSDGTMTRIYGKGRKELKVQIWMPVVFRYSGIPTFEPSGRRSF